MTINLVDNNPRIAYSLASGVTQQTFAVPFEFFDDGDLRVYVDGILKAEGTHYSVTGGDGSTGNVVFNSSLTGISGGSTIVIFRSMSIERTSDFSGGSDINRAALNEQLDSLTAMIADLKDRVDRTIQLNSYEAAPNLTMPIIAARQNRFLAFDNSGGVIAVPDAVDISNIILGANYVIDSFTGSGAATAYTLSTAPGSVANTAVYIDGIYQSKSNYTVLNSVLTFSTAPPLNSAIEVVSGDAIPTGASTTASAVSYNQGGTGSVSRTVQSRLRDFVSVQDFGAIGNGVTNDAAAFTAAWAATAPQAVYVPAKSYAITGTVTGKFYSFGVVTVVGGTVTTITNLVP